MEPLEITRMKRLMAATEGRPGIVIGVIDGPVDTSHNDFKGARLRGISSSPAVTCSVMSGSSCLHGTFVAGMLCAGRSARFPGICPGCTLLIRPIFHDGRSKARTGPAVTPGELARAIIGTVNAGAGIINFSMGLGGTSLKQHRQLMDAINYASARGVLLVAASGNNGGIGPVPLFNHNWVIPVASCDMQGRIARGANTGPSVGRWGLMAPGTNIHGTAPGGGYTTMSGTSAAAPLVSGVCALLWSLFPRAAVTDIKKAILLPGRKRKSIMPPLLDAEESWQVLKGL